MNSITRFYPGDEAALFAVNVLAQVTAAGLLVWLARGFLRKVSAATRHGVYLAALAWMMLSPLLAYICQSAGVVWVAIPVPEAQVLAEPKRIMEAPVDAPPPRNDVVPDVVESAVAEPTEQPPASVPAIAPTAAQPLPVPQPTPGMSWGELLRLAITLAFLLWGLGVFCFLARLLHGLRMLASLRREVQPIDDERLDAVRALVCETLGVAELPLLVASRRVGSPIAIGICRPMVVLPVDLVDVLDERQLREVLIHECAHVLRRDPVVGLLQRLAEMLFWPHPLVHLLNRELAQAREEVCDNHVLLASNGPDYARTLLALAECCTNYHDTPATSGLLGPRWRLEDRVAGLLNQRRKRMIRMNRIPALVVAVVFMTTALAIAGARLTAASAPQAPASETTELAPPTRTSLVPDKKGENPMPPAVPQISEAVEKDGLSITVAPAKAVFRARVPLAFVVALKNVSKEPFMLFGADGALRYEMVIDGVPNGGPWVPFMPTDIPRLPFMDGNSKVLQPGATREIKLLGGYQLGYREPKDPKAGDLTDLNPGKYRISVTPKFTANPALILFPHKHWVGAITTKPVEFTVAAPKPPGVPDITLRVPDSANGLSISVKPAKTSFALKEDQRFTVSFKNISKKPLLLYDIDQTMLYQVEFYGFPTGGPWLPQYNLNHSKARLAPMASDSRELAAGATLDQQVVLNGVDYSYREEQIATPVAKGYLDAGKYRVMVGIKLKMNPAKADWKAEHWIGEIAARSAEFEIGYQKPGAAVVAKGLSVVVTAEQPVIPVNEFPKFKVRFENVSTKDFSLFGFQYPNWTVQIKNKDTGLVQTWKHAPLAAGARMPPLILTAGKSHEETCVLNKDMFYVPPKNVGAAAIEPGKYEIVFEIELREAPNGRAIVPAYWVGPVRTAPMEFTVGDGGAKKR